MKLEILSALALISPVSVVAAGTAGVYHYLDSTYGEEEEFDDEPEVRTVTVVFDSREEERKRKNSITSAECYRNMRSERERHECDAVRQMEEMAAANAFRFHNAEVQKLIESILYDPILPKISSLRTKISEYYYDIQRLDEKWRLLKDNESVNSMKDLIRSAKPNLKDRMDRAMMLFGRALSNIANSAEPKFWEYEDQDNHAHLIRHYPIVKRVLEEMNSGNY